MTTKVATHEGVLRPALLRELEEFRCPGRRVSSYYLNLDPDRFVNHDVGAQPAAIKDDLRNITAAIDQLGESHAVREALRRDVEVAADMADDLAGRRGMRSLALFVASEADYARAFTMPWPVRDRAFFEDHFVLWPLRQWLDQSDRYCVCLTDTAQAAVVHFWQDQPRLQQVGGIATRARY